MSSAFGTMKARLEHLLRAGGYSGEFRTLYKSIDLAFAYIESHFATTGYVDQFPYRTVPGASDDLVVTDIGAAVRYTNAGAAAIAVHDLSAAAHAGKMMAILLEYDNAASAPVLTPTGAGVTLKWPGGTGAFTPLPGVGRTTITSVDGLAWTAA